jgi:hypothetical protein
LAGISGHSSLSVGSTGASGAGGAGASICGAGASAAGGGAAFLTGLFTNKSAWHLGHFIFEPSGFIFSSAILSFALHFGQPTTMPSSSLPAFSFLASSP